MLSLKYALILCGLFTAMLTFHPGTHAQTIENQDLKLAIKRTLKGLEGGGGVFRSDGSLSINQSGSQNPQLNNQTFTIDRRVWSGIDSAGARNVDLSKQICSSNLNREAERFYLAMEMRHAQEFYRDGLKFPETEGKSIEELLKPWLDYTTKYEAKLHQNLAEKMSITRLDTHFNRAKTVISQAISRLARIPEELRNQMAADIESVRLMTAARLQALPDGPVKDDLIKGYIGVCGPDLSSVNAFYTPVFDDSKEQNEPSQASTPKQAKLLGHYMIICPQYMVSKVYEGHTDAELVATIGHELGHAIDARKHITFNYRDRKQIEIDYGPVYTQLRRCIGENYASNFVGLDEIIARTQARTDIPLELKTEATQALNKRKEILRAYLGRPLLSYDSYMGEITADYWGTIVMADFLSQIKDPFDQITHLRGNLSLFCRQDGGVGDGVHPPHSFRVGQATQYPAIRELLAKSNQWQIVEQPYCGI